MISILLVGTGNVASHLYAVFSKVQSVKITQINSRELELIPKADVTILAVSDDAIGEVSSKISNPFVVHTSGSSHINDLKNKTRKGVFYMLQTFTKNKKVHFAEVPFCLEAEHQEDLQLLKKLAALLGDHFYSINSDQRKAIHVAAVFVNNFSNHMFKIGSDISKKNNFPFEILKPLIHETVSKINELTPEEAQTGPAIRKDQKTIKNHLNLLDKNQQEIYKILTKSIQNGTQL